MGFLEKLGFKKNTTLEKGVEESRNRLLNKLGKAIAGKDQIDDAILDELEEILITSDVGVDTTLKIICNSLGFSFEKETARKYRIKKIIY